MPYENEHACRINSPDKYSKFARKNCAQKSNGKCIDVIYGIKSGKSEIQALRYPKKSWEASSARSHCSSRGGSFEAASGKCLIKENNNMERFTKIFKGEIKEVDKEKSTVTAKISDQTLDRHGDIILISAWAKGLNDFKKHPVLLSSHSYGSLQSQIGKIDKVWVDEKEKALMAKMTYFTNAGNPEADWGFKLAEMGQAAYSVGFMVKKAVSSWTNDEDEIKEILSQNGIKLKRDEKVNRIFTEVNLLENSHVTVPANPSALQKGLEEEENPILLEIMDFISKINEDLSEFEIEEKCTECEEETEDEDEGKTMDDKGVVDFKEYTLNEKGESWDGSQAKKRIKAWASNEEDEVSFSKYKTGFLWFDSSKSDSLTAYKAPHHDIKDDSMVTHWRGVVSAMVVLLGGMGGLDIPDSDRESAYNHLKEHYSSFDVEAPEYRTYKTFEDVVDGCKDVFTASLMLEEILSEKSAKIFKDLLENIGIKSEVETKLDNIVDSIVEKISEKVIEDIHNKIKNDIEVSTDIIVDSIDNLDIRNIKSKIKDAFKDEEEEKNKNYIEEILDISSSLKKVSV